MTVKQRVIELLKLTELCPEFELPYYWLSSYFSKYNLNNLAKSYAKVLSVESLRASSLDCQNQNKIVLSVANTLNANDLIELQKALKIAGFSLINTQSINLTEQESTLQKKIWTYTKPSRNI